MTYKEIYNLHKKICNLTYKRKLNSSFKLLTKQAIETGKEYYSIQVNKYLDTYKNILKHSFSGITDPERNNIYSNLIRSILELNDELKELLLTNSSELTIYKMKWSFDQKNISDLSETKSILESLIIDDELRDILDNTNNSTNKSTNITRQQSLKQIFNFIWFSDKYKEIEINLVNTICNSSQIPWHDKSLIVSALTLSLLRNFDKNKLLLLFKFFNKNEEQVWQRAFISIMLSIFKYNDRISLYPEIINEIDKLKNINDIEKYIEAVIVQFIKSKDTEKITKQWEEEILPEIMKMQPKLEEKFDVENIISDKLLEDKNPDRERVFEDSPDLMDKLQEFSQMQIEGSDVFMSAFAKLKHFPFYDTISNWFQPFYSENSELSEIKKSKENQIDLTPFIEKLESSFYMCNSDKYSFCLNLQFIPDEHKTMMLEMFNEELKGMEEITKEDEILNNFAKTKSIFTQYIQDLYRFYKLHPLKNEFVDIFDLKLDFHNTTFYQRIIKDQSILRNTAEFFLEKNHFDSALEIFLQIEKRKETDVELFEKIAYCYQRMGDYKNALAYYKKADLFDTNKAWITKKIALCYRYLNEQKNALHYYKEAEELEPENLYIQAFIGHTLLRFKEYEKALKYYFKVEYLAPENTKIQGPIAWISFVLGKFDTAKKYYKKLLEKEQNINDTIYLGHVYWCSDNLSSAIQCYTQYVGTEKYNYDDIIEIFNESTDTLLKHGIDKIDLDLMKDYIIYSKE
ncbi:MAG: hypothetical protein PF487_12870 [Bacteroidales bacterium]|jgi:tetratricopeptide (TPR) repeat protein|nr:hypothetical protein [Bacteroidales bacterium]